MSALDNLPTGQDMERAAAVLHGEAAKLARFTPDQGWTAPEGGPPAPGAAESALGYIKVALALEALQGPLGDFEAHMNSGGAPIDFLMGMMAGEGGDEIPANPAIIEGGSTHPTTIQEG